MIVFLPLRNIVGGAWAYFILFVAPIIFAVLFFYFHLPETKGRNTLEVHEEFLKLPTIKEKKKKSQAF